MDDPLEAIEAFVDLLQEQQSSKSDLALEIYDEFPQDIPDDRVAQIFTDLTKRVQRHYDSLSGDRD